MPTTSSLTVMDKITEPILPELDPSLLDFRPMDLDFGSKDDNPLNWTSQLQSDFSVERGRGMRPEERLPLFDEDDMNVELDLDLDLDDEPTVDDTRKGLPPMLSADEYAGNIDRDTTDAPLNMGNNDITRPPRSSEVPSLEDDQGNNADRLLPLEDDPIVPFDDNVGPDGGDTRIRGDSHSPLSSARSSVIRNFNEPTLGLEEEEEEPSVRAPQRAKRRKIIQADRETVLSSAVIRAQQEDRSAILKPESFLPRDPFLLNLMVMQRNGGFVSSVMRGGGHKGMAPELQGLLSIDNVRKSSELKRKRDSGVSDMGSDDSALQLQIPDEPDLTDEGLAMPAGDDETNLNGGTMIDLPPADDLPIVNEGIPAIEDDDMNPNDNFDYTEAPLLHPIEQGPVSLGTQHAVHLLRDRFGVQPSPSKGSPSQPKKASVLFQDMLPERSTSKADATKMFFEVLVLATKDAVKVEQSHDDLGGPLRIRGKRGLWGAWAEKEAGGEIEGQDEGVAV